MTDKQPEALRLAASLELCWGDSRIDAAASELRRQHAENESLLTERERNLDSIRVNNEIINKKNAELETLRASHGQAPARATLPEGWVPLLIIHEGQYPEEIAYGPRRMMDRLDKWLRKYFDSVVAAAPTATAQAAPAAVAGPSGYGPKVTVKRRCSECKACNSESYAVQGDSGHYVYCEHPSLPERKYIGDTHWDTPDWCPAAAPTTQPAPQQEAQEPVAWSTGITWNQDPRCQSEIVLKLTRRAQPLYGYTIPLYTAPQPVEREPLTPEQRDALWESCKYDDGEEWTVDWEQIVDAVERHHRIGIKGGQHGVDT